MVIGKGEAWGRAWAPDDPPPNEVATAAELAAAAADGSHPTLTTAAPDVLRTLGLARPRPLDGGAWCHPWDLGRVRLDDGQEIPFTTHVVAARARWAGRFAVILVAPWDGDRYLGPRTHPNDGRLDVIEGRLSWRDRLAARRRVVTGTHLPHPDLRTRRAAAVEIDLGRATPVRVDGRPVGRSRRLRAEVEPDALTVVA